MIINKLPCASTAMKSVSYGWKTLRISRKRCDRRKIVLGPITRELLGVLGVYVSGMGSSPHLVLTRAVADVYLSVEMWKMSNMNDGSGTAHSEATSGGTSHEILSSGEWWKP
jgi:hypothetical protein